MDAAEGVLARARVVLEIEEVRRLLARGEGPFTDAEQAYARAKSDPERRLAARLAAKRATCEILGPGMVLEDVEVVAGWGSPPTLRLSARAQVLMRERGGSRLLLSLTHERSHAAAVVLLLAAGA